MKLKDTVIKINFIIILGCSPKELELRTKRAIELVKELMINNKIKKTKNKTESIILILSGKPRQVRGMIRIIKTSRISTKLGKIKNRELRIEIDDKSNTTLDNIKNSLNIISRVVGELDIKSTKTRIYITNYIITSDYHKPRVLLLYSILYPPSLLGMKSRVRVKVVTARTCLFKRIEKTPMELLKGIVDLIRIIPIVIMLVIKNAKDVKSKK